MRSELAWLALAAAFATSCGQGGGYAGGLRSYAYYVYVTNRGAATVSTFSVLGAGNLVPLTEVPSGGNSPVGIVIHPSMSYVYVLNGQATGSSGSSIAVFSISPADGSLTQTSQATLPSSCGGLALDPSARFIYAACSSVIATLNVTGEGATVSGLQTATVSGGVVSVAVDPSGRHLYAANEFLNTAQSFSISATGALTLVGSVSAGTSPYGITADPQGRFIVTANLGSSDLTVATVNAADGSLSGAGTFSAGAGGNPKSVIVDPTGSFVYSSATSLDELNSYAVQSDFKLVSLASYQTNLLPAAMTYSPDNAYLVLVNSGSANVIYLYSVGSGGTLTFASEGAADLEPSGAAVARFLAPSTF